MEILMPQLGETVAEGKITKWFKAAGDAVQPGDNLFEIETDKVSMEVPSTTAGVLSEIRITVGEVAPVGAVVGVIAGTGETAKVSAVTQSAQPPATTGVQAQAPRQAPLDSRLRGNERQTPATPAQQTPIKLDPFFEVRTPARNYGPARLAGGRTMTPLARRLAGEAGIDLSRVTGSGPHGRIVARDIETAPPPSAALAEGPSTADIKALFAPGSYDEVPLDSMRRTIAARLTLSAQTVPQFYLTTDVELDRLIALREEANAAAAKDKDGKAVFKLSLNDFVIRALALALQRVPAANVVWAGDRILRLHPSDIGVAVALDGGLITPLLRGAETKSVSAISAEMKDLAARARDKKLKPAEYQGGSSAISNLGMHNVREFTAIINPPHATILAVGAARRQAVEKSDGGVAFVSMLSLTLSCDHRVVDGALGAELLAAVKNFLESPVSMLV
ncbi:MAG TPA: dihydrolipoamide acetyltransferase family protein [Xanthobacteraceae bacterium]|nr:dihydrolipoamide acetyltransferase family protein [Xanthobacteraceae bacterium]